MAIIFGLKDGVPMEACALAFLNEETELNRESSVRFVPDEKLIKILEGREREELSMHSPQSSSCLEENANPKFDTTNIGGN